MNTTISQDGETPARDAQETDDSATTATTTATGATPATDTTSKDTSSDTASTDADMSERIRKLNAEAAAQRVAAREAKASLKKIEEQLAERERTDLIERQEYEKLYESERAQRVALENRLAELETQAQAQERELLLRQVASEKGIPAVMVDRLRGETREELETDADALLAALPRPIAPKLDGATRSQTRAGEMPADATIREEASRLGVSYEAYKRALEERAARR